MGRRHTYRFTRTLFEKPGPKRKRGLLTWWRRGRLRRKRLTARSFSQAKAWRRQWGLLALWRQKRRKSATSLKRRLMWRGRRRPGFRKQKRLSPFRLLPLSSHHKRRVSGYGQVSLREQRRRRKRDKRLRARALARKSQGWAHGRRVQKVRNLRRIYTRRALLFAGVQMGLFGILAGRLYKIQVVDGAKYRLLADENRISLQLIPPKRGRIVDRFGRQLAHNEENLQVVLIPYQAHNLAETLSRLEEIVALTPKVWRRVAKLARRQNPQWPIFVRGGLSWEEFSRVNVSLPRLPGIRTEIGWSRRYDDPEPFAHVLGYLGAATKEQLAEFPVLRLPGMRVGKFGVEAGFEERLRGKPGIRRLEVDARGRVVRELGREPPREGQEIALTVDRDIQRAVMERIGELRRAAVVAMAVETGEIIAMASTPSFDPNKFAFGISQTDWTALQDHPDDPLTNKALRGQYPPGSTFKMVTALAGLEAGVIKPKEKIWCSGGYAYKGIYLRDWKKSGHRAVNLHKAIKVSCDVYFYELARRVGITRLAAMARQLGLGQTYDCGLPSQKPGVVPDDDWKRETLGVPWYGGETLIAGIGQGYVLTTPLQLAVMTARIASGRQVVPRIVLPDPGTAPPPPPPPLAIDPEHLAAVRKAMEAVVNEPGGTAGRAALGLPGVRLAGKTGTAQVRSTHGRRIRKNYELDWEERDHALFVCFAPTSRPRYAVSVVVEHGGSGSRAASPVARDVMRLLIQRDPLARPPYTPRKPGERGPGVAQNQRVKTREVF